MLAYPRACTCLLVLALGVNLACGKEPGFAIEWNPDDSSKKVAAVWLGYLMARAAYREKHHVPMPGPGKIAPTFDEEVFARETAVSAYSELREKDKNLNDRYWNELARVQKNKFVPQYVWLYLHQPSWSDKVRPANLEQFRKWSKENLPNHRPETHGALSVTTG